MKKWLLWFLLMSACSGGGGGTGGGGGSGLPDAGANSISLRTMPHSLPAGMEDYRCTWFAPSADPGRAIRTLHPVTSPGVHHISLFFAAGDTVQAERSCVDFGRNWVLVAGAGVGSDDVDFPDGVALPVRTDGAYVLQVHMLNASQQPMDVRAGYDLGLTAAGANWQRAGVYLTGTTQFSIPAGATGYSASATCSGNLPAETKLISLFPHMHKLGVHFHVDRTAAGATSTIYDGGWLFDSQSVVPIQPEVPLAPADSLTIRCTWDNPGPTAVAFGLHTSDEMCFGVFYYYPATTDQISCMQ
jgi:hypothetical protein